MCFDGHLIGRQLDTAPYSKGKFSARALILVPFRPVVAKCH